MAASPTATTPTSSASGYLRPPAVAGLFYPGDGQQLAVEVSALLAECHPPRLRPKALIAPHAGYIYSGPVAAQAYALLEPLRPVVRRVLLLGPVHRVPVRGLATTGASHFRTPLGDVPIDGAAVREACRLPQVAIYDQAHGAEHSLEVHLPFLQTVLDEFSLVPFAVGMASASEVAEVLDLLWGGEETLIVVSSDLSHYQPYQEARQRDRHTADDILHLRLLGDHEQACGATPINGLLEVARRRHLRPTLLDLRNSGDTAGDKSRVVGYGAFAFEAA
ncbi:AmmeMemoRadiSam system protein B [Denitratisoma sp. DHT3]|uniref:AmmeMemoRadiSam system protein B n=1 Tax=Denitratisoma sp. DHT3 TaxID=1981880 RepID=UPI0011983403|nr:AmmeMemoRadiSam system protein B [Denitratisoma sp. DHT3]QDX81080.1 AmmeMemoRadiSam system protein B [Denitratisoma sp. DHT3]